MKRIEIKVKPLTSWSLVRDMALNTVWKTGGGAEPSYSWKRGILRAEHSPIRCLMFRIDMIGIPSFVSVHFVRHKFGVEHFVSSNRIDRNGGRDGITRWSPVNHSMVVNAQELMFMSRRRLCMNASKETRWTMLAIREGVRKVDQVLADFMVPSCEYIGRCPEITPCGGLFR